MDRALARSPSLNVISFWLCYCVLSHWVCLCFSWCRIFVFVIHLTLCIPYTSPIGCWLLNRFSFHFKFYIQMLHNDVINAKSKCPTAQTLIPYFQGRIRSIWIRFCFIYFVCVFLPLNFFLLELQYGRLRLCFVDMTTVCICCNTHVAVRAPFSVALRLSYFRSH